jgi:hypothetical protein
MRQKDSIELRLIGNGEATLNTQRPLVCTVCGKEIAEGQRVYIYVDAGIQRHEPGCKPKTLGAWA